MVEGRSQQNNFRVLHEFRGAYTDLRDLIRLRYAARKVSDPTDNKISNPLAGLLTSKFRGRGIDFAEVRIYQPRDDVRTIDWRVTARTGTPHTRIFQEEKERPVLILTDQSSTMYFGSRVTFKSVLAARAAALIAWAGLERGDRVGGIVFSGQAHREVRPRRSKHSVLRYLNELHDYNHALNRESAKANAVSESGFTDALARLRRVARQGSVVFIISDFAGYQDESRRHLQLLARHSEVVGIHISDPLERELPSPDIYSITDGLKRSRINTAGGKNRQVYENNFRRRLAVIQEEFMRVRSPLLTLETNQPLVEGLNRQSAVA